MAPTVQTTPRKDGKTAAQADADMTEDFNNYYVADDNLNNGAGGPGDVDSNAAQSDKTTAKSTPKRAKRKQSSKTSFSSLGRDETDGTQSSPLTRQTARTAAKRAAEQASIAGDPQDQGRPASKRVKLIAPKKPQVLANDAAEKSAEASGSSTLNSTPPSSVKSTTRKPTRAETFMPGKFRDTFSETNENTIPGAQLDQNAAWTSTSTSKKRSKAKANTSSDDGSLADDQGDDESSADAGEQQSDVSNGVAKGKGKEKAKAEEPAKNFVGTPSMHGTCKEKPQDATRDVPWQCANRGCMSGQTWFLRDGKRGVGRKVISHFFGRNQTATKIMHAEVWHIFCRKCYQVQMYQAKKIAIGKCKLDMKNLETQLDRIELWRPDAKFEVKLTVGAINRLNEYRKVYTENGNNRAVALAAVTKTARINNKNKAVEPKAEYAFPLHELQYFESNFHMKGAISITQIRTGIFAWVKGLIQNEQITCMPPIQLMLKKQTEDEHVNNPLTNYADWERVEDAIALRQMASDAADEQAKEEQSDDSIIETTEPADEQYNDQAAASEHDETEEVEDSKGEDAETESECEAPPRRGSKWNAGDYQAAADLLGWPSVNRVVKRTSGLGVDRKLFNWANSGINLGGEDLGGESHNEDLDGATSTPPSTAQRWFATGIGDFSGRGTRHMPGDFGKIPVPPLIRKARDDIDENYNDSENGSNDGSNEGDVDGPANKEQKI